MMGGTLSCNGLDFCFKQSPNGRGIALYWVGHCFVMIGTLSCNELDFCVEQSPNGWDIVL